MPERGVLAPRVVADRAHDRLAGVEPHSDREVEEVDVLPLARGVDPLDLTTAGHRPDVNACRNATSRTKVGGAFLLHALTPSALDAYGRASTHAARIAAREMPRREATR
jgi:hypothetical protein